MDNNRKIVRMYVDQLKTIFIGEVDCTTCLNLPKYLNNFWVEGMSYYYTINNGEAQHIVIGPKL